MESIQLKWNQEIESLAIAFLALLFILYLLGNLSVIVEGKIDFSRWV